MTVDHWLDFLVGVLKRDGIPEVSWTIDTKQQKVLVTLLRANGTTVVCDLLLRSVRASAARLPDGPEIEATKQRKVMYHTLRKIRRLLRQGGHYYNDIYGESVNDGRLKADAVMESLVARLKASAAIDDAEWDYDLSNKHARKHLFPHIVVQIQPAQGQPLSYRMSSLAIASAPDQHACLEQEVTRILSKIPVPA